MSSTQEKRPVQVYESGWILVGTMAQAQLTSDADFYTRVFTMTKVIKSCVDHCDKPLPSKLKGAWNDSVQAVVDNWIYLLRKKPVRLINIWIIINFIFYLILGRPTQLVSNSHASLPNSPEVQGCENFAK